MRRRGHRRNRDLTDEQRAVVRDMKTREMRLSIITAGLSERIKEVESQHDWEALEPIIRRDLFEALNQVESIRAKYDLVMYGPGEVSNEHL